MKDPALTPLVEQYSGPLFNPPSEQHGTFVSSQKAPLLLHPVQNLLGNGRIQATTTRGYNDATMILTILDE